MKLFGNATNDDVEEILDIVHEILDRDDLGEALGAENSLIEDPTLNSTESDAGLGSANSQTSGNSRQMSTGKKTIIAVFVIVGVVFLAGLAYTYSRGKDGDGSGQRTMAATADQEELYGA